MTADAPVYLGVDLGTSALKVVAVDLDGRVCGRAHHGYPTQRPEPGAAEQDPAQWRDALRRTLDDLAVQVAPGRWAAIGLSAMLPTLVELDAAGQPLAPAITWEDGRAEAEGDRLCDLLGADRLYRVTGQRVDGRYLAPMHARLAKLGRAGTTVAGAKDVLYAELTGRLLTDPSTAAGYGLYDLAAGRWDAELVARSEIPALPEVAPAASTHPLRAAWAQRYGLPDLPVVLGAADSALGALGLGAVAAGDVAVIAGTSAIVLGVAESPVGDPERRYLVTPLAGPGWGLEMDLLAVGSAFGAMADVLGFDGPAELLAAAATVAPADAPLFLPYLAPGEQGALWDPSLTGTLHGLRLDIGRAHIARALLNGVIVELRRCIEILESSTGKRGPVLLGGAAAASPLMWQDLADATGRDVTVDPQLQDHSALGAALFAASALGVTVAPPATRSTVHPEHSGYATWSTIAERQDALRHNISRGEQR